MALTTSNMGLKVWNLLSDLFSHSDLQSNWNAVDAHDHTSTKGVQIPTGGLANAAVTPAKVVTGTPSGVTTYSSGLLSARPTAGSVGAVYYATDTALFYMDTGSAWQTVSTTQITSSALSPGVAQSAGINQTGQVVKGFSYQAVQDTIPGGGAYALASHPDQVSNLVMPANGLMKVLFRAHFDKTVGTTGSVWVALFVNSTSRVASAFGNTDNGNAAFAETALFTNNAPVINGVVGTGPASTGWLSYGSVGTSAEPSDLFPTQAQVVGAPIYIAAPAGTYTVSVQYKADAGITGLATQRLLYAQVESYV